MAAEAFMPLVVAVRPPRNIDLSSEGGLIMRLPTRNNTLIEMYMYIYIYNVYANLLPPLARADCGYTF